jgi:hypothetical protein
MNRPIFAIALALSCTAALSADDRSQLPSGMAACAEITDVAQRAACYDRQVAIIRGKENARDSAKAPESPKVATPPPAPADFGAESLASKSATSGPEPTLEARIARLQELQPGVYTITLDNGQVWRQPERREAFELKTGDAVRIRKATMGAYRLWLETRGAKQWVRVVRVQ